MQVSLQRNSSHFNWRTKHRSFYQPQSTVMFKYLQNREREKIVPKYTEVRKHLTDGKRWYFRRFWRQSHCAFVLPCCWGSFRAWKCGISAFISRFLVGFLQFCMQQLAVRSNSARLSVRSSFPFDGLVHSIPDAERIRHWVWKYCSTNRCQFGITI